VLEERDTAAQRSDGSDRGYPLGAVVVRSVPWLTLRYGTRAWSAG
jgi:hypothetical protein